ncbi:HAMP domain-containing protein [Halomicrobium urmianum]|uniref:HAMP domain-containing protein n=1 Tax=Halomicrobium urmianum TaxID=1586233 RepID=UPI001CD9CCD9|nr:methyl-accepting chemotaxis protein [Halomicrobium urmianum]
MAGEGSSGVERAEESVLQGVTPDVVRRSFALKFGIVLVVMALSIGVIGIAATQEVKSQTQANVQAEYQNVAGQEADLVEQWIGQNRLTTSLVSNQDVWAGDEGLEVALRNEQSELPAEVSAIHVVESSISGTSIEASTSLNSGTPASEVNRDWLANQNFSQSSDVRMSEVYLTDVGPVVGFLSPVSASDNRFLLIEYDPHGIADDLQGAERASGGFTQVVASDGTIMIDEAREGHGVGSEVLQSYSNGEADGPIQEANHLREHGGGDGHGGHGEHAAAGVTASMEPNENVLDEPYTVGYAPVPSTDWVVLVHAPESAVFGWVNDIERGGILATLAAVVMIGGVGIALGYNTATSIDRLRRKADEMRDGNLDVEIASARIDNIGQLYDGFADMRDSLKRQIEEAEKARKEAEVSRAEAMEMNNYLQEKAEEFSAVMGETAAGDMTSRMDTDGENEAMDQIAGEFNEMMNELEKTTGQLKSFSDEVADSSDVVLESAESVRDASEQVAESIQKISDDAYDQQDRLRAISEDLDELVASLEDLESEADVDVSDALEGFRSVATELQDAADTSEGMMAESENVAGAAEEQAAELNEVSSRAERLKRYARPLGDILERFETEAEHEFVFSGGPSQSTSEPEQD